MKNFSIIFNYFRHSCGYCLRIPSSISLCFSIISSGNISTVSLPISSSVCLRNWIPLDTKIKIDLAFFVCFVCNSFENHLDYFFVNSYSVIPMGKHFNNFFVSLAMAFEIPSKFNTYRLFLKKSIWVLHRKHLRLVRK